MPAGLVGEEVAQSTLRSSSSTLAVGSLDRTPSREAHYTQLFEELRRPAFGMVRRAFGSTFSDEELEDIYSAAWLSSLAALERKERELSEDELRRYVLTAVANQASREMRRRGRKPTLPIEVAASIADSVAQPDELASQAERSQLAREVLGSLPLRRRAVMMFRYGWGLEPSEVCSLIEGLSLRAYRKEVERGVAEVARKLRMAESGEWCESREPLLRAFAAGLAGEEEARQARQHLSHCRACHSFVGKLSGHLHDLGTSVTLAGATEALDPGSTLPLIDRAVAAAERGKQAVSAVVGRGTDAAEQTAGQIAAAGGTRGGGVVGAGALAKLAGFGAVPKVVAACVGTGAAATACVAAGVVPGVGLERERPGRPEQEKTREVGDRSDVVRHAELSVAVAPETQPQAPVPPVSPGESSPSSATEAAPEPTEPPVPEPSPTVQEFEPMGTRAVTQSPAGGGGGSDGGGGGGSGGSSAGSDFGP